MRKKISAKLTIRILKSKGRLLISGEARLAWHVDRFTLSPSLACNNNLEASVRLYMLRYHRDNKVNTTALRTRRNRVRTPSYFES